MKQRRTFVITGAGSDIGTALATFLDTFEDVDLVLVSRSTPAPKVDGRHTTINRIDLTNPIDVKRVAEVVDQRTFGPFNLVHCAGDFWKHKPLVAQTNPAEIVSMINSHYITLALTAQALLPLLIDRKGGRIVAFSCNSVLYNYPDMSPFTSAKAAVECFIKCIANEYSGFGIVANTLALPTILTKKVKRMKPGGDRNNYLTPEDLAALVVETLSTAPPSLNGNTLKVFRHSPSFFGNSYFERNPREREIMSE